VELLREGAGAGQGKEMVCITFLATLERPEKGFNNRFFRVFTKQICQSKIVKAITRSVSCEQPLKGLRKAHTHI
jgi:hypothetical protein